MYTQQTKSFSKRFIENKINFNNKKIKFKKIKLNIINLYEMFIVIQKYNIAM